jgi:hypothetical protein
VSALAIVLVIPFATVPALLGWPLWARWAAPFVYFAVLVLVAH